MADARTLITSALPLVAQHITSAQFGQMQKVLDAAVVNPVVQKEYAELRRKAVYETAGGRAILDQSLYQKSNKVFEEQIVVTHADKRIRLDFAKLLTPEALKPTTDNPDEAAYLQKIRNTLMSRGVWLRFTQPLVRIPNDPGGWMIDPRTFEAWLSLGPDGDAMPTKDGRLTRQALLGTNVLGANYYTEVYQGSIERTLKNALNSVKNQISQGRNLHLEWDKHRDDAAPLVVPISDALGGANFPSTAIWDAPHRLMIMSLEQNVDGNVKDSSQIAIYAAIATEIRHEIDSPVHRGYDGWRCARRENPRNPESGGRNRRDRADRQGPGWRSGARHGRQGDRNECRNDRCQEPVSGCSLPDQLPKPAQRQVPAGVRKDLEHGKQQNACYRPRWLGGKPA